MDRAAALQYNKEAPLILAVAKGELVKKMLKVAREKGITIYRDNDLAEVLSNIGPGREVPENLFSAVAAVMAYCYNVNREFRDKIKESGIIND